jgi:maltooligosyltrehalose trehalohydrolase
MVAEGRAKEFSSFSWKGEVPNPQALDTFERSKLDWNELSEPAHAALFEWHRSLIALRAQKPAGNAKALVKFDEKRQWLRFAHQGLLTVLNFADHAQRVPLPAGQWQVVLRSDEPGQRAADEVQAHSTVIYKSLSHA